MAKQRVQNYVFLPGVSKNSNAHPNAYSLILNNKEFIKTEVVAYINSQIELDNASNLFPNAVSLLTNNKEFLIEEIIAWTAARVAAGTFPFAGYTYSESSCRRDTAYLIDAYIYDLRYGGNEKTIAIAEAFWQGGTAQLISPTQEVIAFAQIATFITDYVFTQVAYTSEQSPIIEVQNTSGAIAESGAAEIINQLSQIITVAIPGGLSTLPPITYSVKNYAGYVYDSSKCFRDVGLVLDAYLHDLRYGGNEQTRYISSRFWNGTDPQISGDRKPEITAEIWIKELIINTLLPQANYTPLQESVPRFTDINLPYEISSIARITSLADSFIDVLTNGLSSLPALQTGVTTIRLQGKYDLNKLLLITNSTTNQILYNFTDPTLGATVETSDGYVSNDYWQDEDYPAFRNTADYVTTIRLDANTSTSSVSDDIQIFVEEKEMRVRPYDFGTDAIERHRVAQAQSMLDADFEYGLQPTKWQAIGVARGYPSVYEIPGSDTSVLLVETDASAGTGGTGASKITVTTAGAHGFSVGTPITIKGLANTVSGFSRAEGTFIVDSVASATQFSYYAVSKVGTINPSVLATTYTQLRKADFYTGATIGTPSFGVFTNGQAGEVTSKFITPTGSDQMAFIGTPLAIGAPLSGIGIASGSQVSGVVGSGGLSVTTTFETSASIGATSIVVSSAAGILEGMAIDNGTGTASFVSSISGTTLNLTAPLTTARIGNTQTYSGISGTSINSGGNGATFTVERIDGQYATVSIVSAGLDYAVLDRVRILGTALGGASPANDLIVSVGTINETGGITAASILSGTSVSGDASYNNLPAALTTSSTVVPYPGLTQSSTTGSGINAAFTISRSRVGYSAVITTPGTGYIVGDSITINGALVGGTTPTNNVAISIDQITASYSSIAQSSTSGAGTGSTFNVTRLGNNYSASIVNRGTGFLANDTVTLAGTNFDGTAPGNNLTITVTVAGKSYTGISPNQTSGSGLDATFNITRQGGVYLVTLPTQTGVGGYNINDTVTIFGDQLGGTIPDNNLVFTVTGVTSPAGYITSGTVVGVASTAAQEITNFTVSGTANGTAAGGVGAVTVSGTAVAELSSGSLATFNVTRVAGVYSATVNNAGTGYAATDQITILGTSLGGASPANDLIITVESILVGGAVNVISTSGSGSAGDATYTGVIGTLIAPIGSGSTFVIRRSNGNYTINSITSPGINYFSGERIRILGNLLGGVTPDNDAIISVGAVGSGNIINATISGSSVIPTSVDFYSALTFSEETSSAIPDGTTISGAAIAVIEVSFPTPHGLVPGAGLLVDITSNGSNHILSKGPFFVESAPTANIVRFTARSPGSIDTATPLTGEIYSRPDSYFIHRPYDGGVQLGTGGPQHGAHAIRMSKKYIRYQSGKGINYCTGAMFCPSFNIQNITASGTAIGSFITVTTDDVDHGCQVGGTIRLTGIDTKGYNGTYQVYDVVNERSLRIRAISVLSSTLVTLSTNAQMSVVNWHGATVRAGTFDDQNGLFFQYDGQTLAVGRRSSTFQLAGFVNIAKDTNVMNGTNTRFRDQVKAGDRIVIKGMTHVVTSVNSQTQLTVNPDYRGAIDAVQAKICLTQDFIIPQSEFNLDRIDGTGPSGYNVDLTKMQMIGMQWSWYAVGFIDFMLRGSDGNFIFFHRIRNSNVNTEAYMRSGNLPVRYEVINEGAKGKLEKSMTANQNTISLVDARDFPNESGVVQIDNELISYSGKTQNTLTGCTRAAPLVNFSGGSQRTFTGSPATTHEYNTGVVLVSTTISPIISHWGSAMLTDGLFDEDRGYLFSYTATGINVTTTKTTAFLIRLAPSVSNAIVGDLGERELLNRAQLLLSQIEITSDGTTGGASPAAITGGIVVEGVLNPQNYPTNPADIAWGGLSGLAQGGQPSFAQVAPGGSVNWAGGAIQTTATATALGSTNGNITVPNVAVFNRSIGTSIAYITRSTWDTVGAQIGFTVSDAKFPSGTTVTGIVNSPDPVATTLSRINSAAQVTNLQGFNTGNTQIWFRKDSWEALCNPVNVASAVYYSGGGNLFPFGTRVTNVSSLQGSSPNQYYIVTFAAPSTSFINSNTNMALSIGGDYSNTSVAAFTSNSWNALPLDIRVSTTTNDIRFATGTSITAIATGRFAGTTYFQTTFSNSAASIAGNANITFNSIPYYTVSFSRASTSAINSGNSIQLTLAQSSVASNFVYFTQASWDTLVSTNGATTGSEISDSKFPAGTRVSAISPLRTFSGAGYYTVTFNQTSNVAIAAGNTITFRFGAPPYALPGETVFSFIANPGERGGLELNELKELTNTVLGGRGTYPNGPDVLAINVYKIAGTATPANIILRWGEAQA